MTINGRAGDRAAGDGLAVVDKPAGWTSHDVVARCRRIFGQRRVGHAGTLDPDATGVLLVGAGRATRLLQFLSGLDKTYTGEIVLGVATSTLDAAGTETGRWDMAGVSLAAARDAARALTGDIWQVPPMVSALKVGGRRLHELAREGKEVERAPRQVHVARFELVPLPASAAHPEGGTTVFGFEVACSSGTYVRSLAADLGAALGGGAHLRLLRRRSVGPWSEHDAVALDDLDGGAVRPMAEMVRHLAPLTAGDELAAAITHGKVLPAAALGAGGPGPWAVVNRGGDLLAIYQAHTAGQVKPAVVVAAT